MKAIYADASTAGEVTLGSLSEPAVSGRSVLIEIHATSMNPHDWKYHGWFKRFYKKALPIPGMQLPKLLLGHDVSGVVVAVGDKVTRFKEGDEVYCMSAKTGAFAEYITVNERMIALKPKDISHAEAATIPMAALTAWQALQIAKAQSGEKVLVIGGSGGVGVFAVQIAKLKGAEVTAVCSGKNVEFVRSLGADHVVDYTLEDVRTGTESFDIVFDTIGGESAQSCKDILSPSGRFLSTTTSMKNIFEILRSRTHALIDPATVKSGTLLAMPIGKHLEKIASHVDEGTLKTVVDKTFDLVELEESMNYSKLGRTRGKIAIKVR